MTSLALSLVILAGFDHRFQGGELGALSISIQEVLAGFILYMMGIQVLATRGKRRGPEGQKPMIAIVLVVLYSLWLIVGAVGNQALFHNSGSLHGLKDTLPALVLFAAMIMWIDTPKALHSAHQTILLMLVALAVIAGSQFVWGWPYWNPVDPNAYMKHSMGGLEIVKHPVVAGLGSPNTCAVFLAPLSVLTIGWLATGWLDASPGQRWWRLGASSLTLAGIALTQAKATLAISVVGCVLVVTCVLAGTRVTRARAFLALTASIALGGFLLLVFSQSDTDSRLPIDVSTLVERAYLNQIGIDQLMSDKAILALGGGVGLVSEASGGTLGVHNEYLRQCLQGGVPAAGLFVAVLVASVSLRPGWVYVAPLLVMAQIFLVESAVGNQLQSSIYIALAMNAAAARIKARPQGPT